MKSALGVVSAALLALAAPAGASEILGGFVDLRFSGELLGANYNVSNGAGGSQDLSWDTSMRGTVSWIGSLGLRSYGGWLWGLGGAWNYSNGTINGEDDNFQAWAVDGYLGYAIPFGDHFQVEALPFIGFGRAFVKTPVSRSASDGAAPYREWGVNFNAVFTLGNGFQFGGTLGLLNYSTDIVVHQTGQVFNIRGKGDGMFDADVKFGAFIGCRL